MRTLMKCVGALALLAIASVAAVVTPAQAFERWLDIHNDTSYELCYVYISHIRTNDWGPDLLGDECIPPGYYMRVDPGYQQGYCRMDMKFVFEDDTVTYRENFNICDNTDFYLYE